MSRVDSPETVRRHAEAALALMQRHGVAPSPPNFAIWYEHAAGHNPGLDRALAPVVGGVTAFSPKLAEEIHGRFLRTAVDNEDLRAAGQRLHGLIAQVMQRVGEAGRDHVRYSQELATLSGGLAQAGGAEDVAALIGKILSATQGLLERNQRLEGELSVSTQEIGELKQHLEQTRRAALTDPMTGIANRKHFESQLDSDTRAAAEAGEPLSLLLIDVDHFKRFNDTHGHLIGDEVLKVVARTLKTNLKGRDTAARYGGEEFAVILPQTALAQAAIVGEHVRRGLATHSLTNRKTGQNFGTITVSVGVSSYRVGEPLAELVERADQALYSAKRLGRNRVAMESEGAARESAA
jgi:diguanylate cyclase